MPEIAPVSVWTRPRPAARRQAPGVEQFVAHAIAIADADGLAAVSMRRIAGDLGSGTASLYRAITGRDELLELMVDAVQGERPLPPPTGEWRTDLGNVAHGLRRVLLNHPWLSGELAGRPSLGPNGLRVAESALRAATALTPDITAASRAVGTLAAYVRGAVSTQQATWQAQQRSGLTTEQWQRSVGPYIQQVIAAGEHPMLARRVIEAEHTDPDSDFAFGLDCVLDGLAARLRPGGDLPAG